MIDERLPQGDEGATPAPEIPAFRDGPEPGGAASPVVRQDPAPPSSTPAAGSAPLERTAPARSVVVVSRKGGVGKTTTSLMVGHALAAKGERVLAIDANPDGGSLADRIQRQTPRTLTDLSLAIATGRVSEASAVEGFVSRADSGLEVLAGSNEPQAMVSLTQDAYRRIFELLSSRYRIFVCDTGTRITEPTFEALLRQADQVVLCGTPPLDSARVAARTLDWFEMRGYRELARGAVVALGSVQERSRIDVEKLQRYFEARTRAVIQVPWDEDLALGSVTPLDLLQPKTRRAFERIADEIVQGLRSADLERVAGLNGSHELVDVRWGAAHAVAVKTQEGRVRALEVPGLVSGGRTTGGDEAYLHLTGRGEVEVKLARLAPQAPGMSPTMIIFAAPGLVDQGRGPDGRPVFVVQGDAGGVKIASVSGTSGHVHGVGVLETGDGDLSPMPDADVEPWIKHGRDSLGNQVMLERCRLRLHPSTVVADPLGVPIALVPAGGQEPFLFRVER